MLKSEIKIRVRYGEVDRMGYLHHGNYALYFEEGRTELIRELGLSYREMEDKGVLLPVRDLIIRYHNPVFYDDEIRVQTQVLKKPEVKLQFEYKVLGRNDQLHCEAKTTLVFVDAESRKPIRCPEFFARLITKYFN